MTNRDLETKLRNGFQTLDTNDCPSALFAAVRQETYMRSQKNHLSFSQFLSMQIRFIGWKVWAVQGVALFAVCFSLYQLLGMGYWEEPQSVVRLLVSLSVLVFMTIPPFLYRSARYQMQEVESANYFSAIHLLSARLLIIGAGDIALMGGIMVTTAVNSALQTGSTALSLALPFLFESSIFLYFLGHASPRQCFGGSFGLCAILLFGLAISYKHISFLLMPSVGWAVVCMILAAFCCHQFQYLLHYCAYIEKQIA